MKVVSRSVISKTYLAAVIAAVLASGGMTAQAQVIEVGSSKAQPDESPTADEQAEKPSVKGAAQAAPAAKSKPTEEKSQQMETISVLGIRETIQSSIAVKRESTAIVDAISSKEIGGLPATSIGEAIETITGASTHREKGGATEIAIRGLGPFLGGATFNGREASNGSGDRSVNFNQFPSELINSITIYKTQQANLIEGSVSGQIELQTVKPLDFGKRIVQLEMEGNQNEYQRKIKNGDDVGWRGTASYVDQYELGDGKLGVSLGLQRNDTNNPEEVYTSSSTWVACDPDNPSSSSGNCNAPNSADVIAGAPFYTAAGSHALRQISEDDLRDSYFAAFQYQPNESFEFNLDYQKSQRTFHETRQDLNLSETLRGITNPVYTDSGVLLAYDGNSSIESTSLFRTQKEDYDGGGLNMLWYAADNFQLSTDYSFSKTTRVQTDRSVRLRSDALDIYGNPTEVNNQRVSYSYDARNGDVPTITIDPRFDVNNWDLFSDDARLRRDEQYRNNKINAFRLDGSFTPTDSWVSSIDSGLRLSRLSYNDYDDRVEITQNDRNVDREVSLACRTEFPQSGFLGSDTGNSIFSWATFDPLCQYLNYLGTEDPGRNTDVSAIGNNDIKESTESAYVMATFNSSLGGIPVRGNFGIRNVTTKVTSNGLRSAINVLQNPDGSISLESTGEFTPFQLRSKYARLLPSFNAVFDLDGDLLLRTGVYRAMARPDPSDLGAGREIQVADGETFATIGDAVQGITATGSPGLKPLMSWNADVALEYYPNADSILAGTVYYKRFEGGYNNAVTNENYVIGGENVVVPVVELQNSGRASNIYGLELSAAYRFSFLPQPFDGLGFKMGYNYANSNFKTEDIRLGDVYDAVTGEVSQGIIPPANIFGLSKHVLSTQLFWEYKKLGMQAIYKYRSNYYQKFVGGPSQIRYVDDVRTVDLRASYRVNDHVQLQLEAINVLDEPKVTYMPVQGSIREYNQYGARYYAGVVVKF